MARNGSGTYSLPAGNPVVTGTTISSTWANNTLSDIATALTASVANDGQTPILANQDFGGFNISNIGTLTTTALSVTNITMSGNFLSTGLVKRFQADFSNATLSNRFGFQTSVANAGTIVGTLPNGTATASYLSTYNSSDADNASRGLYGMTATEMLIQSTISGTGTLLPLSFYVGASLSAQINTSGNWTYSKGVQFNDYVYSPIGVAGKTKNLAASATGTSANITVTADAAMLEVSGLTYTARTISLTINSAGSGANGLDTGSIAASTWYSVWVIYNPTTATVAGLISTSATAPTMPAGYTYKARVGWVRTDGTANKYPLSFTQKDNRVQYKVAAGSNVTGLPLIASGAAGDIAIPTWVAASVSNFVPSTAASVRVIAGGADFTSMTIIVAPNNAYGAAGSTTNPPPLMTAASGTSNASNIPGEFVLESTNIYWANNNGNAVLACLGWIDNI